MRKPELGHYIIIGLLIVVLGMGYWIIMKEVEIESLLAARETPVETSEPQEIPEPNPHLSLIRKHEAAAGMPLARLSKLIIRDEGTRASPYLDTAGAVTIGVGRNLTGNGISTSELYGIIPDVNHQQLLSLVSVKNGRIMIGTLAAAKQIFSKPLTEHDVQLLLVDDLKNVQKEAVSVFPTAWQTISTARREAILDVLYNEGLPHFKGFKNFIASVKAADWKKAAGDLLMSEAARQNPSRYFRNARVIETGNDKYFELK